MLVSLDAADLAPLVARARKSLHDAVPPNTRRAYEGDLRRFAAWCTSVGLVAMPAAPQTVVLYMRQLADNEKRVATIERALAAICVAHARAGSPSLWNHAIVDDMRAALRRELGVRPVKKIAADDEKLRRMCAAIPASLLGARDRSLLTLGWMGALRRSNLVGVELSDITRAPKGLVLLLRHSKTDQERHGEEVPIFFANDPAVCPVRSLDAWLAASGITGGKIFRRLGRDGRLGEVLSPASVSARVKRYAKLAGFDPSGFGAHSLRSGFVTTAARRGRDLDSIMVTTRHHDPRSARGYIQRETIFERAAGEGLL